MNNLWQISGPRQRFGSGSLHYGGSLPRRLLRQNTTSTVASASASNSNSANQSSCGFKYAEAHEIATATLRHGCLQPTVGNFSDFIFASQRPSSIYSCSIGHIWEHEFCHLGCWAVLWKISETTKILLLVSYFWGWFFQLFEGKKRFKKFLKTF